MKAWNYWAALSVSNCW